MDQDRDPAETREWLDALDSVEAFEGIGRVDELLDGVVQAARRKGAKLPFAANTAYVNTISPDDEPAHPGDRAVEHKIRSLIRWNAAAIVLRANKTSSELGGHIASFQSAATLYDTGASSIFGMLRRTRMVETSSITKVIARPASTRAHISKGA